MLHSRFRPFPSTVVLGVLLTCAGVSWAQAPVTQAPVTQAPGTQAPPDDIAYAESLDVRLMELDVMVTDRSGAPIRSLAKDDFEITVGKQKVKPTHFAELGSEEPVMVILAVDGNSLRSSNLRRTIEGLRGDLRALLERPQVALRLSALDLEGDGDIHAPLRGPEDVEWAIARLSAVATRADRRVSIEHGAQSTLEETLRQLRGNARDRRLAIASIEGLIGELTSRAAGEHEIAQQSLQRMHALVRSLSTTQGRKVIVLLTDGVPVHPLDTVVATLQSVMTGGSSRDDDPVLSGEGQAGLGGGDATLSDGAGLAERNASGYLVRLQQGVEGHSSRADLDNLIADANAYRVSFVPILGLPGDAAAADARAQARGSATELTNMREPLNVLAEETGGVASTAGTVLTGFVDGIVTTVEHGYSIGFDPPKDLTTAEVRVKVKTKGAQVRAPRTVTQKAQNARLADRTMGGLMLLNEHNHHGLDLVIEQGEIGSDQMIPVQVNLLFPIGEIGLVEAGGMHRADAQAAVAVLDERYQLVGAQHVLVPLEIPAADLESARAQFFRAFIQFRLPPGQTHRVGLTLWDGVASKSSFVTRSFQTTR